MKLNQKGFTLVEGLLIVIALALVGGVGFYVYDANRKEKPAESSTIKNEDQKPESKKEEPKLPELVDYGDGVAVTRKSEVSKLVNSSESFKSHIASLVPESPQQSEHCDAPQITVTVSKIYKDEFASGGINECAGAAFIMKKENNTWKQIWAGQDTISCEEVRKHNIPSQIQADCYDEAKSDVVKNPN